MKEYLFWFLKQKNHISDLIVFLIVMVIFIHLLNDIRLNSKKSKVILIGSLIFFIIFSSTITAMKKKYETMYHEVILNEYNYYEYQSNIPDYINLLGSKVIMKEKLNIEFLTVKSSGFIEVLKNNDNYVRHSILLSINEEVLEINMKVNSIESHKVERYLFDQGLECESKYKNMNYSCKVEMFEGKYIIVVDGITVTEKDEIKIFIKSTSKLGFEMYSDYSVNVGGKYND